MTIKGPQRIPVMPKLQIPNRTLKFTIISWILSLPQQKEQISSLIYRQRRTKIAATTQTTYFLSTSIRISATPSTPNQGRNSGTKAIKPSKTEIIKLTGVNQKSSNSRIETPKCQKTIKQVAWISLVISFIRSCLFQEKMCLIVKYWFGMRTVSTKVVSQIVKQNTEFERSRSRELRLPKMCLKIEVPVEKIVEVESQWVWDWIALQLQALAKIEYQAQAISSQWKKLQPMQSSWNWFMNFLH